jgi:hypothetical protein
LDVLKSKAIRANCSSDARKVIRADDEAGVSRSVPIASETVKPLGPAFANLVWQQTAGLAGAVGEDENVPHSPSGQRQV